MQKTRKIEITRSEAIFICSALKSYDANGIAAEFNRRFKKTDPANDGPEVAILREQM